MFATAADSSAASETASKLLKALEVFAPSFVYEPKRYWKFEDQFEFFIQLDPASSVSDAFETLVGMAENGWARSGTEDHLEAVWNPQTSQSIFLLAELTWAHLESSL